MNKEIGSVTEELTVWNKNNYDWFVGAKTKVELKYQMRIKCKLGGKVTSIKELYIVQKEDRDIN